MRHGVRRWIGASAAAALLWAGSAVAMPAGNGGPAGRLERLVPSEEMVRLAATRAGAPKGALEPHLRKVDTALRTAMARLEARGLDEATATRDDVAAAIRPPIRARADGSLLVTIRATSLRSRDLRRLRAAGFEPTFVGERYGFAEGWAPIFRIESLARLPFVTGVAPVLPPEANTGAHLSEGDAILLADQARADFGVSGAGVKVGVISDSVDGLQSAVMSGDLPNNVQVLEAGTGAGEGTAMLEIVHDLAPGAALAFYGPDSSGDMITGINQLVAAGAKVIVDDLTFFDQPHFQAGPIAQAVNAAAAAGVVYATSAGNFAATSGSDRGHYEAPYVPGGSLGLPAGQLGDVHDFGAGDIAQSITLFPGASGRIFMQWDDPFGASANDFDLYVVDAGGTILAEGINTQNGSSDPFEFVQIQNPNAVPVNVFVILSLFDGTPRRVELYYAGGITNIEHGTPAGSIAGHANASGAITVASVNADDPGSDDLAAYSSRGPCDLLLTAGASADKPDLTAIDGVEVSGAAGFPSPFFGTSAAAPHVAAVAALLLEARPTLTPAQVRAALQTTAVDLGAAGFDFGSGSGRVDALAAVGSVQPTGAPPSLATLAADLQGDELLLDFTGSDVDGDVTQVRGTLRDEANQVVADTGFFGFDLTGQTDFAAQAGFTGLADLPTALRATLQLGDNGGDFSATLTADFSGAVPGGPLLTSAKYARKKKRLTLAGTGFSGLLGVEINGVTFTTNVVVNRKGTSLKLKQAPRAAVGLLSGPNRIRAIAGGLHSNIFILVLP